MSEIMNKQAENHHFEVFSSKFNKVSIINVDLELLNEAQIIMADVVKKYGDQYLPIFIRIHKEVKQRKNELSYKEIALQIAANDSQ